METWHHFITGHIIDWTEQGKCNIDILLSIVTYSTDFWTPCCRCIDRKVNYSLEHSWPSEGRLREKRPSVLRTQRITASRSLWLRDATGTARRTVTDLNRYFREDFKKRFWVFLRHSWHGESPERTQRLADCWNAHKVHIVNSVFEAYGTVGSLEAAQVPSARLAFESVQKRPQTDCIVDQNSDLKLILNVWEECILTGSQERIGILPEN